MLRIANFKWVLIQLGQDNPSLSRLAELRRGGQVHQVLTLPGPIHDCHFWQSLKEVVKCIRFLLQGGEQHL